MALGSLQPEILTLLCTEDAALENLTVLAYAVAALLALAGLLRRDDSTTRKKSIFALLLGLAVFGALEELSYGQRLLGLERPWVYHTRFDSAHDLVVIGIKIAIDLAKAWGALFYAAAALCLGVMAALLYRARHWLLGRMQTLLREPAFFYAIVFVGLLVAATSVDAMLYFVREGDFLAQSQLLEELLETSAAFALVWGVVLALRYGPRGMEELRTSAA